MRYVAMLVVAAAVAVVHADEWVIAPDGFYVLQLNAAGEPVLNKDESITGYVVLGEPPDEPPPPPEEDEWGLVALSRSEAGKVEDPDRNANAAKVGIVYVEMGKLVQGGQIKEDQLASALDLAFQAALGDAAELWEGWKDATGNKYNEVDFDSAEDAGQGLIDIGRGAQATSTAAIDDWITGFIQVLPAIVEALEDGEITLAEMLKIIIMVIQILR